MKSTQWAFLASFAVSIAGTCIALSGLASIQSFCHDNGYAVAPMTGARIEDCGTPLSKSWVTWGLQALLLLCAAAAWATDTLHSFKSSLWSFGALATAQGIAQCWGLYRGSRQLEGVLESRFLAFLAGAAVYSSGNLLLFFSADSMYRLKRIQGVKGFISFKVPRALGSDLDLDKKGAPASKPAGVHPALGLLDWLFLAALALAAASWCIALGGTAALQSYCLENNTIGAGFRGGMSTGCTASISLYWLVWALQLCFMGAALWALMAKQIHNYRCALWSLAAVVTALASFCCQVEFYSRDGIQDSTLYSRRTAVLAGFACVTAFDFLLMVLGDAAYRERHIIGVDGFVSIRPARGERGTAPAQRPRRGPLALLDWAFLAAAAVCAAGLVIAVGGLASAYGDCDFGPSVREKLKMGVSCRTWLSWPWYCVALQTCLLALALAAWGTRNIHNYKNSLWALMASGLFVALHSNFRLYELWPVTDGQLHTAAVVAVYGFSVLFAGTFLMMVLGDALHHAKRLEGADGYVTLKRPNWTLPSFKGQALPNDGEAATPV